MKITNVSESLIAKTKKKEGFSAKPYPDPGTKKEPYTIGYGTTRYFDTGKKVTMSDKPISELEADRLLRGHFSTIVSPLVDKLCRDDLDQNEFDSLADFIYNAGATYTGKDGKVHYYNLFENVNKEIPKKEMIRYWESLAITGGGVKLNGLIARRKEEVETYYS
jgi:lysozyme